MGTEITIGVAIGLIVGIIAFVSKHVVNSDRHPNKADLVFRDVCEAKHKGFEDCVESKVNSLNDKFDIFRTDVKDEFAELKSLIKNKK